MSILKKIVGNIKFPKRKIKIYGKTELTKEEMLLFLYGRPCELYLPENWKEQICVDNKAE